MTASVPSPVKAFAHVHLLVVDDDIRLISLIRSVLQGVGFTHVHTCQDGVAALELLKKQPMDIVICDWEMEPVSGLDMVQLLRHTHGINQKVPVIMLSGHSSVQEIQEARDAGITEYVVKPFTAQSLCTRIMSIIEHPRRFVISGDFTGHSRRRRSLNVPEERRGS